MNRNSLYDRRFKRKLFQPVDNSPLIIFRIIFGFLLCYHIISSLQTGAVYRNFIEPPFTFNFIGFDFLQPLPGNGMYYYFGVMAFLALFIMLGAWYRISMTGFAVLWTLQYLMQKSGYNNHYYLILLLCWLMVFVPANHYFAVDAYRRKESRNSCPQWTLWLFAAQAAVVYFFAAVSKLNADWFSGKFIAIQFSRLSVHPVYGILYGKQWFPVFIAYTGFLFDLLIIPFLLWKRTRRYAFLLACAFHVFNSFTFRIGIFPYLSILLCIFFFEPGKIRSIFFRKKPVISEPENTSSHKKTIFALLCIYMFFQVMLPLRSVFFPGNVFWTEEGYRMSWKMMLRSKSGTVHFKIVNPASGKTLIVDPKEKFSPFHVTWIAVNPDITWQYAQALKKDLVKKGIHDPQIYAIGSVSMNRSKAVPLVDSTVDLASVKWHLFQHSSWITKKPD